MIDRFLCSNLISRVSQEATRSWNLSSRFPLREFRLSEPLDTGGTSKFLKNSLFFCTEDQCLKRLDEILNTIFRDALDFRDLARQQTIKQKEGFRELLRQFLKKRTSNPIMVWATPRWFLMTNPLPKGSELHDRASVPDVFGEPRSTGGDSDISLFCGDRTTLTVPLEMFRDVFFYPAELGRKPKIIRLLRTRMATSNGKTIFQDIPEDAILLARPGSREDDLSLGKGKVPAQQCLWTNYGGPARLECSTITFAKLYPDKNLHDGTIEQLTLSLARDGRIVDIRGSSRRFDIFLLHHYGLRQALVSNL